MRDRRGHHQRDHVTIDDGGLADGDWIAFARLRPDRLTARDLSFHPSA